MLGQSDINGVDLTQRASAAHIQGIRQKGAERCRALQGLIRKRFKAVAVRRRQGQIVKQGFDTIPGCHHHAAVCGFFTKQVAAVVITAQGDGVFVIYNMYLANGMTESGYASHNKKCGFKHQPATGSQQQQQINRQIDIQRAVADYRSQNGRTAGKIKK